MRKLYQLITLLSCALLLTQSMNVMAQHEVAPVVPGSQGTIPANLPVLTPAHEGEFPGLRLDRLHSESNGFYYRTTVELKFSVPGLSKDNDVDYFTLFVEGEEYMDCGVPVKFTNNNAVLPLEYMTTTYRVKAHGGKWDGMMSNEVTVTIPSYDAPMVRVRGWYYNFKYCVVGNEITAPEVYIDYDKNKYTEEQILQSYQYRWIRRNPNNYEDTVIEGATSSSYTPTIEDVGYILVCQVYGDDKIASFIQEFELNNGDSDSPVYFPVYCSFDYCDNDGIILNTSHALPNFQNNLKVVGEWDWENNCPTYFNFTDVRELQKGQYLMAGDLDLMNVYYEVSCDFGNPNIKLAAKYGEGEYMMIREVILRPDEGCRNLSIKNSSAITNGKVNFYGKNIYGDIALKRTMDLESSDTIVYLNKGKYYVQVETGNAGDAPTYYPNATNWKQAQLLEVSDWDETPTEINIQKMTVAPVGTYRIEGSVQKAVVTRAVISNGVEGVRMLLLNDKKELIATTTTNENGEYSFINLAEGTYYVTPELASYETTVTEPITLSGAAQSITASYTMGNGTFTPVSEASGINTIHTSADQQFPAYDLIGRKMGKSNGILIIDNKKVIK